ncbi:DUF4837 family protein [Flavobacterium sp. NKUCC04_CG]|uniref:DUF4837 family protein n=1 Tax=Flavobacterium sp. NKUCC04_CG TaxID=2842121 RepID=UPI001C5AA6CE|nr:DUF4837 family protein [Flavobacterium sp. NKUCC04_CG]
MKKILIVCIFFLALACKENRIVHPGRLPDSVGKYNYLTLIMNDSLWIGSAGDSIRKYLAVSIDGLSQEEPQFDIIQFSPRIFVDKNRLARNIIVFSDKSNCLFTLERSKYATPQNIFTINAPSYNEMVDEFRVNIDSIVSTIKKLELNEMQHALNRGAKLDIQRITAVFGVKMMIPNDYKFVFEKDDFIWLKKNLASGNSNLLFYEVPISRIENGNDKISNIIQVKDSIGEAYIHGTVAGSFMKTDEGYSPFIKNVVLDQMQVKELRGTWDIKNSFMNGPYICYVFKDEYYDRYLFVEGFTYHPSNSKRDLLFELEAIIKTIKFHE